jgi:hypothetical protein
LIGNHHKRQTNRDSETQKTKRLKTQKEKDRESVPVLTTAEPRNLNAGVRGKSDGGRSAVLPQRRTGEPKKPDLVLEILTASLLYSSLRCCFGADRSSRFGASPKMNIEREREWIWKKKSPKSPKSDEFHQNCVCNELVSATGNLVSADLAHLFC